MADSHALSGKHRRESSYTAIAALAISLGVVLVFGGLQQRSLNHLHRIERRQEQINAQIVKAKTDAACEAFNRATTISDERWSRLLASLERRLPGDPDVAKLNTLINQTRAPRC